jgi:hypothetical protein
VIPGNSRGLATSVIPYNHLTPRFFQPSSQDGNSEATYVNREGDLRDVRNSQTPQKRDALDDSRRHTSNDTMSNATMLMTLIIGLIAGPAVSL